MGYFETPKRVGNADVAERLGIAGPTFSEHLAVAQRKLLDQLLAT
jgi:predicted DNA binding protein